MMFGTAIKLIITDLITSELHSRLSPECKKKLLSKYNNIRKH